MEHARRQGAGGLQPLPFLQIMSSETSQGAARRVRATLAFCLGFLAGAAVTALVGIGGYRLLGPQAARAPAPNTAQGRSAAPSDSRLAAQLDRLEKLLQDASPGAAPPAGTPADHAVTGINERLRAQQDQLERLALGVGELLRHHREQQQALYQGHLAAGAKLHLAGEFQAAIGEYDQALAVNAKGFRALLNRGMSRQELQLWEKALADFYAARDLDPNSYVPWNNIAWLLATCPLDELRDGALAVENATRACELSGWKNYAVLSTLAAALAEAGDFEGAQQRQREALDLAPEEIRESFREPLERYARGEPLRIGRMPQDSPQ